jgi:hypothetical protein
MATRICYRVDAPDPTGGAHLVVRVCYDDRFLGLVPPLKWEQSRAQINCRDHQETES